MQLSGRIRSIDKVARRVYILVRHKGIYWAPFTDLSEEVGNAVKAGTAVGISVSFETSTRFSNSKQAYGVEATSTTCFKLEDAVLDVVNCIAELARVSSYTFHPIPGDASILEVQFVLEDRIVQANVSWRSEPEKVIRFLKRRIQESVT